MSPAGTAQDLSPPPAPGANYPVWHLTVAYDGTDFHGWQIQPSHRTVQGEVLAQVRKLFQDPTILLSATSRTDAGVHALDQHVSFVSTGPLRVPAERLGDVLNRRLPAAIRILDARLAHPGFSARFDACGKCYVYSIWRARAATPFTARYSWHYPAPLDVEAMRIAGAELAGTHDFASFGANPKREIESTIRTLHRLELREQGDFLFVCVTGDSFLYKMVRGIVGYLMHVGRHPREPDVRTRETLAARDRCAAADTAPAKGLFLCKVFFPGDNPLAYSPPLPPHHAG